MIVDLTKPDPHFRRNRYPGDIRLRVTLNKHLLHKGVHLLPELPAHDEDVGLGVVDGLLQPRFIKRLAGEPETLRTVVYFLDPPAAGQTQWYWTASVAKLDSGWINLRWFVGLTPEGVHLRRNWEKKEWYFAMPVGQAKTIWAHLLEDD